VSRLALASGLLSLAFALLSTGLAAAASEAQAPEAPSPHPSKLELDPWALHLSIENDAVSLLKKDRFYTNGLFVALDGPGWRCDGAHPRQCRLGVRAGQQMYTPDDIDNPKLITSDRPYAGWLFGGVEFSMEQRISAHRISLDLGIVGPESKAEETQSWVHKLLRQDEPQGWDHQLRTEFGVILGYSYTRRFCEALEETSLADFCQVDPDATGIRFFDFAPGGQVKLGNVFTTFGVGARFRAGWNVPNSLDSLGNPSLLKKKKPAGLSNCCDLSLLSVYVFGSFEGRAVAHNIFLDGNTSKSSHSVDKRHIVGNFELGATFRWKFFALTYSQNFRSPEFTDQKDEWHDFASVKLSIFFGCCFGKP
jgi:hypothetical protein